MKNIKKVCSASNYFEHFFLLLFLLSVVVIQFLNFNSLFGVPVHIMSSAVELKIWAITAGLKKYKWIIKKKGKNLDHIVIIGKTKWNTIEVLINFWFKALSDSYINYDKFGSLNNVLMCYNEMKEKIKNPKNVVEYILFVLIFAQQRKVFFECTNFRATATQVFFARINLRACQFFLNLIKK